MLNTQALLAVLRLHNKEYFQDCEAEFFGGRDGAAIGVITTAARCLKTARLECGQVIQKAMHVASNARTQP